MKRIKALISSMRSHSRVATLFAAVLFLGAVQAQPAAAAIDPGSDSSAAPVAVVEQMPELIGGIESVRASLEYPKRAKDAQVEGTIYVKFVVDKNGRVKNPEIVKGLGMGLDEQVLRVVSKLEFRPGRQGNNRVPVLFYLPVRFELP